MMIYRNNNINGIGNNNNIVINVIINKWLTFQGPWSAPEAREMQLLEPVRNYLSRRHIGVPDDWLRACIEWVLSEYPQRNVSTQGPMIRVHGDDYICFSTPYTVLICWGSSVGGACGVPFSRFHSYKTRYIKNGYMQTSVNWPPAVFPFKYKNGHPLQYLDTSHYRCCHCKQ